METGFNSGQATAISASFARFVVPAAGASSAAYLRYLLRESALLDREKGVLLVRPVPALEACRSFTSLRAALLAYGAVRDVQERKAALWHARPDQRRSHYRVILGLGQASASPPGERQEALLLTIRAWLDEAFPLARAVVVLHRDRPHLHAHVWIEARQVDGRKLDLSYGEFRRLDESWNRHWCRCWGLDEREHLEKKEERRSARDGARRLKHRERERNDRARRSEFTKSIQREGREDERGR